MSSELVIRKLQAKDISALVRMVRGCAEVEDYPGEYSSSAFKTMLKGSTDCFVAVKGVPVGFVEFSSEWARTFVWALMVRPDFRGEGVGSQLLDEVERVAKKRKCSRVSFLVRDWNTAMRKFAQKRKYDETARLVLFDKKIR